MTLVFRIILICISVITAAFILTRIRKAKLNIDDAIFWIFMCVILLVFSIFPQVVTWLAELIGIQSELNFIFLFFIFLLLVKLFMITVELSQLKHKLSTLVQEASVKETIREDEMNKTTSDSHNAE